MNSRHYKEYYLYDLENDPLEKINLINDSAYEDVKMIFRDKIKKYIKDIENLEINIK